MHLFFLCLSVSFSEYTLHFDMSSQPTIAEGEEALNFIYKQQESFRNKRAAERAARAKETERAARAVEAQRTAREREIN